MLTTRVCRHHQIGSRCPEGLQAHGSTTQDRSASAAATRTALEDGFREPGVRNLAPYYRCPVLPERDSHKKRDFYLAATDSVLPGLSPGVELAASPTTRIGTTRISLLGYPVTTLRRAKYRS